MTYQSMQPPKQVKSNLILQKSINNTNNRNPRRPCRENEPLPIDVRNSSPQQQKATEGEGVC
jgi:hypothetical protein